MGIAYWILTEAQRHCVTNSQSIVMTLLLWQIPWKNYTNCMKHFYVAVPKLESKSRLPKLNLEWKMHVSQLHNIRTRSETKRCELMFYSQSGNSHGRHASPSISWVCSTNGRILQRATNNLSPLTCPDQENFSISEAMVDRHGVWLSISQSQSPPVGWKIVSSS